jgi:phosphatidylcholine synthase
MQVTMARLRAAAVHLFTALGAVCALFATLAAIDYRWEHVFGWLGLAFLIDGIDGTFARMFDVHRRLPRFSGERLDLVIDYVTYVFVPAFALLQAGFLAGWLGIGLAAAILLSSLYHFSDMGSKADDHSFVGFPAIWNVVAFYLFAFNASQPVTALVVIVCTALTFVPWRWVHPLRVVSLRPLTLALTALWAVTAVWVVWHGFPGSLPALLILGGVGIYGIALSLVWRDPPERRGA